MPWPSTPYAIDAMPWPAVAAHLRRDSRLILPSGTCDQYGPHLPIGAGTRLAEALADDLSREFEVLRAPTIHYGVNLPAGRRFAGAAGLRSKTLHRAVNELLADWKGQGFSEFVLIGGEAHDPHSETIATASVQGARVRVVEPLTVDLSEFLNVPHEAQHAGEILTSLLLHLVPEHVNVEAIEDVPLPRGSDRLTQLPRQSSGCIGFPSHASASKGMAMYRRIREKIRERVFVAPPDEQEE